MDSFESKGWKQHKDKELGHVIWFVTLWGKGVCWSFGMGTRKNDKEVNYSHRPAQTKNQVG